MNEDPVSVLLETMLQFCAEPDEKRTKPLDKPYLNHGRIVATDGRILIAIDPSLAGFDVSALLSDGPDLKPDRFPFDHDSVHEESWMDVPEVEVTMKKCPTCLGSGKTTTCKTCEGKKYVTCTCRDCGDEHERHCPSCGGRGHYPGGEEERCFRCKGEGRIVELMDIAYPVGQISLNKVYLDKIRRNLANPKIEILKSSDDSNPVRFKFDGGLGYLMQIRRNYP